MILVTILRSVLGCTALVLLWLLYRQARQIARQLRALHLTLGGTEALREAMANGHENGNGRPGPFRVIRGGALAGALLAFGAWLRHLIRLHPLPASGVALATAAAITAAVIIVQAPGHDQGDTTRPRPTITALPTGPAPHTPRPDTSASPRPTGSETTAPSSTPGTPGATGGQPSAAGGLQPASPTAGGIRPSSTSRPPGRTPPATPPPTRTTPPPTRTPPPESRPPGLCVGIHLPPLLGVEVCL